MWQKVVAYVAMGTALSLSLALLAVNALAAESPKKINEKESVEIAEKFIADNGYTTAPGLKKLTDESLANGGTDAEERALRHNTLEPKAYGTIPSAKMADAGWTVVFQYSQEVREKSRAGEGKDSIDDRGVGRAVTMDSHGHHVVVQHKDIFLKACQTKL